MIEGQKKCLEVLFRTTLPNGEMCVPFHVIENDAGYSRKDVRRRVRALAKKGLAEYFRALWVDDRPAGAGYCITEAGQDLVKSWEEGEGL